MPRKSWWARLPFGIRMTAGTSALLLAIGGGAAGVAYLTKDRAQGADRTTSAAAPQAAPANKDGEDAGPDPATAAGLGDAVKAATGDRTSQEADRTATRDSGQTATAGEKPADKHAIHTPATQIRPNQAADPTPLNVPAKAPAGPVITTTTVSETQPIPFRTTFVRDPSMPRGTSRVQTPGVAGVQTVRWLVTYADGRETGRRSIGSTVTRAPQQRVIALGAQGRGRGWGGRGWNDQGSNDRGWDRPRECDADLGPCIHLNEMDCPESVQENSDELAALGEGLSALTPDGELANLGTPCD